MFRWSMRRLRVLGICLFVLLTAGSSLQAQSFVNETSTRLVSGTSPAGEPAPNLGNLDNQEKDYAWADIDKDGDIDLVCVRKEAFTTVGRRVNVLFMNEGVADGQPVNGVLVDRTTQYVTASDIPGDNGFNTPTNDRDVVLVDVNNDTWLDIVTAVTLGDNQPKHIKMPRVYINLGETAGVWQGFQYQDAWIPDLSAATPVTNSAPRFCSLAAGDFTGDGLIDLYFGDYDAQGFGMSIPMLFDYNDRLLVNQNGSFADETTSRFVNSLQPTGSPPQPYYQSTFSASTQTGDMNNDGILDIVKQSSLQDPRFVAVSYGNMQPSNQGNFDSHDEVYNQAAYFISLGDLNNDGWNDMVIVDDFQDRYLLNQANTPVGAQANFTSSLLTGSLNEFGGNSLIVDLDNDGWNDIVVTDVDVDIAGCNRSMRIFRNNANAPAVTFAEQGATPYVNQAVRPQGVHDAAIFDLNGDGWLDMVLGTCTGTQIWMNDPPSDLEFEYPLGLATFAAPGQDTVGQIEVIEIGAATIAPGSVKINVSVGGAPFVETTLSSVGDNVFEFTLAGQPCGTRTEYFFAAQIQGGVVKVDPTGGAGAPHSVLSGTDFVTALDQSFETPASDWTVTNQVTGASPRGGWEQAVPVGTLNGGVPIAPSEDAGDGADTMCFVTENGAPGGTAGTADVDNLRTELESPIFDLDGTDAIVSYDYWIVSRNGSNIGDDQLVIEISNDGGTNYFPVTSYIELSGVWANDSFLVSDFVAPTATVRVRFTIEDTPNNDITEAALDNFLVTALDCGSGAPEFRRGDINTDGGVDISDPVALLDFLFGSATTLPCEKSGDVNDDGGVNVADAVAALNAIFGIGAPIPAPTSCGEDPTVDALPCDNYTACP